MKILFVSDNFYPETNAAASRVYERARYWAQWGHEVTVITCVPNFPAGKVFEGYQNRWYQTEEINGIHVVRVKSFMAPNKGFMLRTLDFLSFMFMSIIAGIFQKRADVVIATTPQFFAGIAGYILSIIQWRPFVLEVSDLWPASIVAVGAMKESLTIRVLEKIELFLYRRAKSIIALTNAFKKDMVKRGIEADKIHVVRNGVELSQFQPKNNDELLLDALGLREKFVVGYIGNFGMAQDLKEVLMVAAKISQPNIQFMLVGDGAEREELQEFAKSHNLSNVIFVSRQPKDKIADYWALCDVALVHLKNSDVFKTVIPSKIFEAMAMEKPVLLVAPEGEAAEIINQTGVGEFIPAGDVEIFQQKVMSIFNHQEQLLIFQEHCREWKSKFSREEQAKHVLEVILGSVQ